MTGGLAWVYDEDGHFLANGMYHADFLHPEPYGSLDAEAQQSIRGLVELHANKTASTRAFMLLGKWDELAPSFIRLTPKPQA